MVEDRIRNIEARVRASDNLPDTAKAELLGLIGSLREELQAVKKEHLEKAETSSGGGGGGAGNGESLDDALGGLTGTVRELEAIHPRLADLANRLAVALANMGI